MKNKKPGSQLGQIHRGNFTLEHHEISWMRLAYELKRTEELITLDQMRDSDQANIERLTGNYKPKSITPDRVYLLIIGLAIENC
jgi:hypothetical protein